MWIAGVRLSQATDILDTRLGLGEAFGGLILLAVVTNLPEIAIVVSASLTNQLGIAVGNILGGIAIQTVVLVFLDAVGLPGQRVAQLSRRVVVGAARGRHGGGGPDASR